MDGLRPGSNWTELYLLGVQDAGVEDEEDVVHGDGAEDVQPEPGLHILGSHVIRCVALNYRVSSDPVKLFPLDYLLFCRLLLMQISKVGNFFKIQEIC